MISPIDEISFFENAWVDMEDVIDESDTEVDFDMDEEEDYDFYSKYNVRFAK